MNTEQQTPRPVAQDNALLAYLRLTEDETGVMLTWGIEQTERLLSQNQALVEALKDAAEYIWSRPRYGYNLKDSLALDAKVKGWRAALALATEGSQP